MSPFLRRWALVFVAMVLLALGQIQSQPTSAAPAQSSPSLTILANNYWIIMMGEAFEPGDTIEVSASTLDAALQSLNFTTVVSPANPRIAVALRGWITPSGEFYIPQSAEYSVTFKRGGQQIGQQPLHVDLVVETKGFVLQPEGQLAVLDPDSLIPEPGQASWHAFRRFYTNCDLYAVEKAYEVNNWTAKVRVNSPPAEIHEMSFVPGQTRQSHSWTRSEMERMRGFAVTLEVTSVVGQSTVEWRLTATMPDSCPLPEYRLYLPGVVAASAFRDMPSQLTYELSLNHEAAVVGFNSGYIHQEGQTPRTAEMNITFTWLHGDERVIKTIVERAGSNPVVGRKANSGMTRQISWDSDELFGAAIRGKCATVTAVATFTDNGQPVGDTLRKVTPVMIGVVCKK